jgi:hypothetical protein
MLASPVNGTQWRFKRAAVIQQIGISLPKATVATALGKKSLRQTMHEISEDGISRFASEYC